VEAQLLINLSGIAYIDSDPLRGETVSKQQARMRRDIDAGAQGYPKLEAIAFGIAR
jgi:hypothetical protein